MENSVEMMTPITVSLKNHLAEFVADEFL
jgi:hypothetical protein